MNESAPPEPVVAFVETNDDLAAMIEVRTLADPDLPTPRLDNLRNNLAGNPKLAYVVARVAGSAVGCGFVDVSHETVARAHVLVVPAARRRGVGTALLAAVSERARASGLAELEGEIRAIDEESLRFFERRGFERVGGEEAVALDLAEADARRPRAAARYPHRLARGAARRRRGHVRGRAGGRARHSGRGLGPAVRRLALDRDRPPEPATRAHVRRPRAGRGRRLRDPGHTRWRALAPPDGGQARLARSRDRDGAEARADRGREAE